MFFILIQTASENTNIYEIPHYLHYDNHGNFKESLLKKILCKFGIYFSYTESHYFYQDGAEISIDEFKNNARKIM